MNILRHIFLVPSYLAGITTADAVNINTSGVATLMNGLNGVSPEKATAIVDYREQNSPFEGAEELARVKRIGMKLVDMNRVAITIREVAPER